jgi:hypothetical protein
MNKKCNIDAIFFFYSFIYFFLFLQSKSLILVFCIDSYFWISNSNAKTRGSPELVSLVTIWLEIFLKMTTNTDNPNGHIF